MAKAKQNIEPPVAISAQEEIQAFFSIIGASLFVILSAFLVLLLLALWLIYIVF